MSKKVLGRGLGAFFPDYQEEGEGSAGEKGSAESQAVTDPRRRVNVVLHIPVQNIRPNPHQPRREFREESLDELAGSIEKHGLIQPVTVRYLGEKRFELISGERRLRAAKRAGISEIPAYVREAEDDEVISFALVENIQREDLNPIEIAMGYQRLIDETGHTQAEVAEKVGKNRSTVANMLRLLDLPPFIQAALRDREISMGHARALITIEDEERQEDIFRKAMKNGWSVRRIENEVRRQQSGTKKKEEKSSSDDREREAIYKEISSRLRRKLSTKVNIKPKKNGGEIRIEYYSREELERLLDLFDAID